VHIYVRIEPRWTFTDVRHAAIAFGRELERRLPGEVTTSWWKEERGERIFVDYNQNARDRTIASAYSIRPKPGAPVSAPLAWEELTDVAPEDFTVATMPARFAEVGDRHATINEKAHSLQPLMDMYEREAADGRGDMPYPPDYPKMPGEPKRVQPSRDRDRPRG
jgi:DNA primase